MTTQQTSPRSGVLPAIGLLARLALGGTLLVAGALKLADLTGSVQSVLAYELVGYEAAQLVGTVLPVLECATGLLLILGLLTRPAAVVGTALMVLFVVAIASAWARGLSIDCGCFGTGGTVADGETAYLSEILRDLALAAAGVLLILLPYTPFSLDRALAQKGVR